MVLELELCERVCHWSRVCERSLRDAVVCYFVVRGLKPTATRDLSLLDEL